MDNRNMHRTSGSHIWPSARCTRGASISLRAEPTCHPRMQAAESDWCRLPTIVCDCDPLHTAIRNSYHRTPCIDTTTILHMEPLHFQMSSAQLVDGISAGLPVPTRTYCTPHSSSFRKPRASHGPATPTMNAGPRDETPRPSRSIVGDMNDRHGARQLWHWALGGPGLLGEDGSKGERRRLAAAALQVLDHVRKARTR